MSEKKLKCRICGAESLTWVNYPGLDNLLGFEKILNCNICQFGEAFPSKSQADLDLFYSSGSYWPSNDTNLAMDALFQNQSRFRAQSLAHLKFKKEMKVLEVGAGEGLMISALKHQFQGTILDYYFIEPDLKKVKMIEELCLEGVKTNRVLKIQNGMSYDVIFLNHVLEHVADPMEMIRDVFSVLRDEGILYIETPSLDFRFKNDVFPHTLFFNEITLATLFSLFNCKIVSSRTFGRRSALVPESFISKVYNKLIFLGLRFSEIVNSLKMAKYLNLLLFKYNQTSVDGIWVNIVLKKR